jgi:hypothetical protein
MQPTIGRQMIGVGVGVGVGAGVGVGSGVGTGVGAGVGEGVGAGVGMGVGFGVGAGVGGVGVWVGVGAAVGRGVAVGMAAAVGAGAGPVVEFGPSGAAEATGPCAPPCAPESAAPVISEPVDVLAIGPGRVPSTPAIVPGPGVEPPAGATEKPGIVVPAEFSEDGTAPAAPEITTFAGSRPSDAGNAGERSAVPMTTATIIAGIRTTATTLADRI